MDENAKLLSGEEDEECSAVLGCRALCPVFGLVVESWTDVREVVGSRLGTVTTHERAAEVRSYVQRLTFRSH